MANKPEMIATKPATIVIKGCTCVMVSDAAVIETAVFARALVLSCVIVLKFLFILFNKFDTIGPIFKENEVFKPLRINDVNLLKCKLLII